jgi:hypothetical protein
MCTRRRATHAVCRVGMVTGAATTALVDVCERIDEVLRTGARAPTAPVIRLGVPPADTRPATRSGHSAATTQAARPPQS